MSNGTAPRLASVTALASVNDPGSLARQFYSLSQALDDYRLAHWDQLPVDVRGQLKDEAQALDTRAHYLTAAALQQISAAIQPELDAITSATADAEAALDHLQTVDSAISIAIAAVSLGAAIATGSIASITSAVTTLTDVVTDVATA